MAREKDRERDREFKRKWRSRSRSTERERRGEKRYRYEDRNGTRERESERERGRDRRREYRKDESRSRSRSRSKDRGKSKRYRDERETKGRVELNRDEKEQEREQEQKPQNELNKKILEKLKIEKELAALHTNKEKNDQNDHEKGEEKDKELSRREKLEAWRQKKRAKEEQKNKEKRKEIEEGGEEGEGKGEEGEGEGEGTIEGSGGTNKVIDRRQRMAAFMEQKARQKKEEEDRANSVKWIQVVDDSSQKKKDEVEDKIVKEKQMESREEKAPEDHAQMEQKSEGKTKMKLVMTMNKKIKGLGLNNGRAKKLFGGEEGKSGVRALDKKLPKIEKEIQKKDIEEVKEKEGEGEGERKEEGNDEPEKKEKEKEKEEEEEKEKEVDSLEAFMEEIQLNPMEEIKDTPGELGRINSDNEEEEGWEGKGKDVLGLAVSRAKKKDVIAVEHSKIEYEDIEKKFYVEPKELKELTKEQVEEMRRELDGIRVRGVNAPHPATKWTYFGLNNTVLQAITKAGFEKPTAIQAQAIPAILMGRDVIGIAKTGSGKTLAFVLPMLRHIKGQRELRNGEGPIGVVMTPTRELAMQIGKECRIFGKGLGIRTVSAYGGAPIKDQIAEFKRGAEIVVCTPGRMIDLLAANGGRVTNLRRATFLVLDEADRMFDMGFEPQVMKIVTNIRPDRQTVLFSATFPRQMEALARKILHRPVEISVGGRSVVCSDVEQHVQIVEYDEKFIELLRILGNQFNNNEGASVLVFVERQEAADNLLKDLLKKGYVCNSLHGGKDQSDRDQTIVDFKAGVFNLLIATSVAARGLDVKNLSMVINYDCPNHMEDYVHRVGRTGRAGNKGVAITFVTPDQGKYAVDLVNSLNASGAAVSPELKALAESFLEDVKLGTVKSYNNRRLGGFGGHGLERFVVERENIKKMQRLTYGEGDDQDEDDEEEQDQALGPEHDRQARPISGEQPSSGSTLRASSSVISALKAAQEAASKFNASSSSMSTTTGAANTPGASKNAESALPANPAPRQFTNVIDQINAELGYSSSSSTANRSSVLQNDDLRAAEFFAEVEINDYPQKVRWKVTNREALSQISESTGVAITVKGIHMPSSSSSGGGSGGKSSAHSSLFSSKHAYLNERKLYLRIEGNSEFSVESAKSQIKSILSDAALQSGQLAIDYRF